MPSRLLLAGLVAVAAAGCGGGGAAKQADKPEYSREAQEALDELDENSRPRDETERIAEMLGERARAMQDADALALSATATGGQQARDRRSARRAKRLAIERVRLVADDLQTDGDRAKAVVTMSYRIRGLRRPFVTERKLVVRQRSVGWRVVRDAARREPLPWEVAAFKATRVSHVVLLTPPGVDVAPLRDGLAEAYREIRRDLPARDLPRSVLVIGARDPAQAERLTGRIARGVVALANVAVEYGPGPAFEVERVLAQRMMVIDSRWHPLPADKRQATLVHEMTHTALNPDTSGRTPPWLVEGVAMYVSGDDRSEEARLRAAGAAQSAKLSELCKPNSIFRLSGREQAAAYAASSAAAEAIVARRGAKGLFRLYDAFNDSTIKGPTCATTTDRVLRRTVDLSLDELDAAIAGG
jgi:hypothetical protein